MIALFLLSLSGYGYACKRWLKLLPSCCPLFTVSLVTLAIYVSELYGAMVPTCWFLLAIGWGFVAIALADKLLKRDPWQDYIDAEQLFFYVLLLVFWFLLQGTHLSLGDEFSFWGTVSRYLWVMKHLPTHDFVVGYVDYPVAAASFHQWVYTGLGGYSEATAYFAQDVLLFAALWPVLGCFERFWQKSSALLMVFLLLALFSASFAYNLMIDTLLAAFFAGIAMAYYLARQQGKSWTFLLLPLLTLCLLKHSGLLFALWLCIYFAIDTILAHERKALAWVFLFVLFALLVTLGWAQHFHHLQVTQRLDHLTLLDVTRKLQDWNHSYYPELTHRYFSALFYQPIARIPLSAFDWLALDIFWAVLLSACYVGRADRRRMHSLVCLLIVGNVLYIFGLYASYLFTFSQAEALALASMKRYLNSYAIATNLVLLGLSWRLIPWPKKSYTLSVVITLLWLACISVLALSKPDKQLAPLRVMQEAAALTQEALADQPKNYRLFLFYQGGAGLSNDPYAYFVLPYHYSAYCTEKTRKEIGGQKFWCGWDEAALWQVLQKFTHLVVVRPDGDLWQTLQKRVSQQMTRPDVAVFAVKQVSNGVQLLPLISHDHLEKGE